MPPAPPPPGPPPTAPQSRLGWYVAGGVLVLILAIGGAVFAFTGGDATSVQEVADQAVEAAEDLDVDAGIDLLCSSPTERQRRELDALIAKGQEESGSDSPDVDYEISDVQGEAGGSFRVVVTSDEPSVKDRDFEAVVLVEEQDGRSCIAGVEDGEMVGEDSD